MISPVFEKLEGQFEQIEFYKLDVDEQSVSRPSASLLLPCMLTSLRELTGSRARDRHQGHAHFRLLQERRQARLGRRRQPRRATGPSLSFAD